jgi:enamine deaminase RidA (YjgF/YER057c/UK114 family)
MTITRIDPSPRLSQAVIHNGLVYVAGQVARDKPGASVKEQTRNILQRIDRLLKQAGTNKSRVLTAEVWLSDIRTFDEMNAVWEKWTAKGNAPARVTVEATLAAPHWAVEIMCTAALK